MFSNFSKFTRKREKAICDVTVGHIQITKEVIVNVVGACFVNMNSKNFKIFCTLNRKIVKDRKTNPPSNTPQMKVYDPFMKLEPQKKKKSLNSEMQKP